MTEENWMDWPNGAQLKDLPVGSRVRYREAHYVRTENGLRVYWAGRAKKIVGTEYLLSKQAFIEPIKVSLPSGYRFEGSEVVKEEAKPNYCHNRHGAYTQLCDESCREVHGGIESPLVIAHRLQLEAFEKLIANPNAISHQFSPGYAQTKPACKCGATENVRVVSLAGRHQCGPCYQMQRRAELQAQKLEQTKRDMSRPVKRDPYEWLGFSSADWEE